MNYTQTLNKVLSRIVLYLNLIRYLALKINWSGRKRLIYNSKDELGLPEAGNTEMGVKRAEGGT
jgi:hypothetical protein